MEDKLYRLALLISKDLLDSTSLFYNKTKMDQSISMLIRYYDLKIFESKVRSEIMNLYNEVREIGPLISKKFTVYWIYCLANTARLEKKHPEMMYWSALMDTTMHNPLKKSLINGELKLFNKMVEFIVEKGKNIEI